MANQNIDPVYYKLNNELNIEQTYIPIDKFFGIGAHSDDIFFSFETDYAPYRPFIEGTLPRADLVISTRSSAQYLASIEIKLTAFPDNSTYKLSDNKYGCEIVVRPDTIVYMALSIANDFASRRSELKTYLKDFSSAGKRDETQGRADLTYKFAEIVTTVQPEWFVMENVSRIKKSHVLQQAKDLFLSANYGLTEAIINASYCRVPQNRKRYFLIGELDGLNDAITPYIEKKLTSEAMTLHDYFGDKLGVEYYYRHPRSYQRRAIFSIHEPSPTIRGVNRPVPSTYQQHKNDAGVVDENLRALTTKERSLIQTFPDNFEFEGTKTNLEQMIGNAVPVKQAEFVANCILDYIDDMKQKTVIKQAKQLTLL